MESSRSTKATQCETESQKKKKNKMAGVRLHGGKDLGMGLEF